MVDYLLISRKLNGDVGVVGFSESEEDNAFVSFCPRRRRRLESTRGRCGVAHTFPPVIPLRRAGWVNSFFCG